MNLKQLLKESSEESQIQNDLNDVLIKSNIDFRDIEVMVTNDIVTVILTHTKLTLEDLLFVLPAVFGRMYEENEITYNLKNGVAKFIIKKD